MYRSRTLLSTSNICLYRHDLCSNEQKIATVSTMNYSCTLCDRYFGSKEAFEQHQQNSPIHIKTIHCWICNRYFGSKDALETHEQASPVHKKSFYCQLCDCFLGSNKALKRHRWNFQRYQECSEDAPDASWDSSRDEAALSYAMARCSIVNMPTPAAQRHPQTLVSANPFMITTLPKRAKTDAPKSTPEMREHFMFPALHANIAEAVSPEISSIRFHEDSDDDTFRHEWHTHVTGSFTCDNNVCERQSWGSGKVSIEIRGYAGNGYSAVVYNQRCRSCRCLGMFVLDEESYIDRVAYRLKKWAGVSVVPPYYGRMKGPEHERHLCEGCKRGKCQEGGNSVLL
ncbi:hypothetical protein HBI23_132310 [Parastagonospora nodorum]|nr:hypothetical protein HBI47_031820 [Parastagonospora nodorum]KAH5660256.1 hypothetical protein HBI23_132310 [Parastagonospora nodorum]